MLKLNHLYNKEKSSLLTLAHQNWGGEKVLKVCPSIQRHTRIDTPQYYDGKNMTKNEFESCKSLGLR